jgi:hypothetical protein
MVGITFRFEMNKSKSVRFVGFFLQNSVSSKKYIHQRYPVFLYVRNSTYVDAAGKSALRARPVAGAPASRHRLSEKQMARRRDEYRRYRAATTMISTL